MWISGSVLVPGRAPGGGGVGLGQITATRPISSRAVRPKGSVTSGSVAFGYEPLMDGLQSSIDPSAARTAWTMFPPTRTVGAFATPSMVRLTPFLDVTSDSGWK